MPKSMDAPTTTAFPRNGVYAVADMSETFRNRVRPRTAIELDRDSNPVRVFHRVTGKVWTHPMDERPTCEHCARNYR